MPKAREAVPAIRINLPSGVTREKGKYVVLSTDGRCMAQAGTADAAIANARAQGCEAPVLVHLDLLTDKRYIV